MGWLVDELLLLGWLIPTNQKFSSEESDVVIEMALQPSLKCSILMHVEFPQAYLLTMCWHHAVNE